MTFAQNRNEFCYLWIGHVTVRCANKNRFQLRNAHLGDFLAKLGNLTALKIPYVVYLSELSPGCTAHAVCVFDYDVINQRICVTRNIFSFPVQNVTSKQHYATQKTETNQKKF